MIVWNTDPIGLNSHIFQAPMYVHVRNVSITQGQRLDGFWLLAMTNSVWSKSVLSRISHRVK